MDTFVVDRHDFVRPAGRPAPVRRFRPPFVRSRRLVLGALLVATVGAGAAAMFGILDANGLEPIELAVGLLFVVNFAWIGVSFWTAAAGFLVCALRLDPIGLRRLRRPRGPLHTVPRTRTAVLMPVYNEPTDRVFAGLEAIYRSVADAGGLEPFEFFVLSDTTCDDVAASEDAHVGDLRRRLAAEGRLFYRRRPRNIGRKAGNIADFCRTWGRRYDHVVVLDADSVMSGETLLEMVRMMEANPGRG